ncbi:MAG: hypothetical protein JXQ75_14930 [Phycisphaerae bacterium]|nr:hypothetical protein [Phycisphaerae bacterium]
MKRKFRILHTAAIGIVATSLSTAAGDYMLDWYTIDGGGEMWSTGGDYELNGTIGQPDAGAVMTSGGYELTGGFWAAPPCWCMSDVNNDGLRNGLDVQGFIDCMLAGGVNCACADLYTDGHLDLQDIATFVTDLLTGGECP